MLVRFPALILLFVVYGNLLSGCSKAVSRRVAAQVLSVSGQVFVLTEEPKDFKPITLRSRIDSGSLVRANDQGSVNLRLIPGALVQVSHNSEIHIEKLKIGKDGNETAAAMLSRVAQVGLHRGSIVALFARRGQAPSQLVIRVQEVVIAADSDCLFSVQNEGAKTRVTCARGKVQASHNGQPTLVIEAGYFQDWPSDRPRPVAAAENASAQIEISDALKVGDHLRNLQSAWQNRLPFSGSESW